MFLKTNDDAQTKIIKWLKEHKNVYALKFFPKHETSHKDKFTLVNEHDSEDDQLDDLQYIERNNENESAIIHFS